MMRTSLKNTTCVMHERNSYDTISTGKILLFASLRLVFVNNIFLTGVGAMDYGNILLF